MRAAMALVEIFSVVLAVRVGARVLNPNGEALGMSTASSEMMYNDKDG